MSRNEKKSKFTTPKKSNNTTFVIIGIVVVAVLAIGGFVAAKKPADAGGTNVGAVDYASSASQSVEFAKVKAGESNGDIVLSVNDLKTKKAATFDVQGVKFNLNNGTPFEYLPLLAYISPKGNIVVASSICEPCSGITFHIEGDELVCNACGTRWSLEDLQGISGGCPQYPPEKIKYSVDGDKLIIKKADVANFQPRTVQ